MKILVVEDNPGDVGLLREAFRELNSLASIIVARDGDECLELLLGVSAAPQATAGRESVALRTTVESSQLPDLIFLDLSLPTISGYEVLRRLKGDAKTRHIPIIVLSSAHTEAEVERAYRGYANAYVRKPRNLEDLMTAARGLKSFWMETARLATGFVDG